MRRLLSADQACCWPPAITAAALTHPNSGPSREPDSTEAKAKLAFTCVHEHYSSDRPPEADVLFQYARWLQKNNLLKQDKSGRSSRSSACTALRAENGHSQGQHQPAERAPCAATSCFRGAEHLRLSQRLIDAGVATGVLLRRPLPATSGSAGLKQDPAMALRYFPQGRRSAAMRASPVRTWARHTGAERHRPGRRPANAPAALLNRAMVEAARASGRQPSGQWASTRRRSRPSSWAWHGG
jgi:hypothetical protein